MLQPDKPSGLQGSDDERRLSLDQGRVDDSADHLHQDGTAVAIPVSVALDSDRASFGSYDQAWKTTRRPQGYPGRAGGPWLCRTLVRSGFQAVVVPSGLSTRVQPQRWITTQCRCLTY